MPYYRAYLVDANGRIFHGEDLEASNPAAAIGVGQALLESHQANLPNVAHGFEIWQARDLIFSSRIG
jgi:hypothetical protein